MRISVPATLLALVLLAGCAQTRRIPAIIGPAWDSPELAFETFKASVLARRPDLIYASFSPGFKEDYNVPSYREFKAGYQAHQDEFDQIARVFDRASVSRVDYGSYEATGLRYARVRISAQDMEGSFILVEIPTAHLVVDIPDYDPEPVDYYVPGPAFGGHLRVEDGILKIAFDAAEAGVLEPEEVREFRLHRQWLLRDIQDLPVNVRGIMDSLRSTGSN